MPRPKNELREQAKLAGVVRYYDPVPCSQGHVAERLTSCGMCVICNREKAHQIYHSNSSVRAKVQARSRIQHAKVGTAWYHTNKQHASQLNKVWREAHKDEFSAYTTQWRRDNLDKLTKNASAYRASKLKATPSWADQSKIQEFYTEAHRLTKETGIKYTVDHQIPLNSDIVCGLHVEHNLQLLTLSENSAKGNRV